MNTRLGSDSLDNTEFDIDVTVKRFSLITLIMQVLHDQGLPTQGQADIRNCFTNIQLQGDSAIIIILQFKTKYEYNNINVNI